MTDISLHLSNIEEENMTIAEKTNKLFNAASTQDTKEKRALWGNNNQLKTRFDEINRSIDKEDSVLDVGCGNGLYLKYSTYYPKHYFGIDINKKLIEEAKEFYGVEKFQVINLFDYYDKFDAVIGCGIFNLNSGQSDYYCYRVISKMFNLANKKVIFNAVEAKSDDKIYSLNLKNVITYILKNLSKKVEFRLGFLDHNYTICIYKN